MSKQAFHLRHSIRIIIAMGWADFLLKYRGSVLGYCWSFLSPLGKFLVIYYVFGPFVSPDIQHYALYLFLGLIIWEHFIVTTTACMNMLEDKAAIIQKIVFPRILLIFMVGWTNLLVFLTHLFIFMIFAWWASIPMTYGLLYLPIIALNMTLVSLGVGMLLSSWCLKYRDIGHLWAIAVQLLFWLTPITYKLHAEPTIWKSIVHVFSRPLPHNFPAYLDLFVRYQPESIIMNDARRILLYPQTLGVPSVAHTLAVVSVCFVCFAVGAWVYQRRSPYFPEEY